MNIFKQYILLFRLATGGVVEEGSEADKMRSGGTPPTKGTRSQ